MPEMDALKGRRNVLLDCQGFLTGHSLNMEEDFLREEAAALNSTLKGALAF